MTTSCNLSLSHYKKCRFLTYFCKIYLLTNNIFLQMFSNFFLFYLQQWEQPNCTKEKIIPPPLPCLEAHRFFYSGDYLYTLQCKYRAWKSSKSNSFKGFYFVCWGREGGQRGEAEVVSLFFLFVWWGCGDNLLIFTTNLQKWQNTL